MGWAGEDAGGWGVGCEGFVEDASEVRGVGEGGVGFFGGVGVGIGGLVGVGGCVLGVVGVWGVVGDIVGRVFEGCVGRVGVGLCIEVGAGGEGEGEGEACEEDFAGELGKHGHARW